jgi:2-keto-4-pentenoate hydratase
MTDDGAPVPGLVGTVRGPGSIDGKAIEAATRRLQTAARTQTPCPPVRDLLGTDDVDAAYAVQQILTTDRLARGARIVGRKIGLTSQAVQQQLGVDRPDFGTLFEDMHVLTGGVIPIGELLQPRVEAEVAFILGADLDEADPSIAQVRASVDHAVAALEICDSRITGWDISITDTVADNASSAMYVLGANQVDLEWFEPAAVTMQLTCDGAVVSEGDGAACLGDPLNALRWLARTASAVGAPLRAGEVVLSGALGPMVDLKPGMSVVAQISDVGSVHATVSSMPVDPTAR